MKCWVFSERWCPCFMLLESSINKIRFWKTCEGQVLFSCSSCLFWKHHPKFFSFFDDWRRPSVHRVMPKEVLLSFWIFVAALAWACPSDSTQDHLQNFLRSDQPMVSVPSCSALPFPSDHWWPLCKGASWIGEWVWSSNKPMWRSSDSVGVI